MYNKMSPQSITDLKIQTQKLKFSYNTIEKEREKKKSLYGKSYIPLFLSNHYIFYLDIPLKSKQPQSPIPRFFQENNNPASYTNKA